MWLQCATLCSGLGRDSSEQTRQKALSSGSLVYTHTHTHPKWYQGLCRKIVRGKRMGVLGQGLEGRGMLLSWVGQSRGLTDWILFGQWGSKPHGGLRGKKQQQILMP